MQGGKGDKWKRAPKKTTVHATVGVKLQLLLLLLTLVLKKKKQLRPERDVVIYQKSLLFVRQMDTWVNFKPLNLLRSHDRK